MKDTTSDSCSTDMGMGMRKKNSARIIEAIKRVDMSQVLARMEEKHQAALAFSKTPLFAHFVASLVAGNEVLNCDDPYYDMDKVKSLLGEDATKENVEQFISCMASECVRCEGLIYEPDRSNPFEHYVTLKHGLMIFTMHGQGTVHWIVPESLNPELMAQLKATASDQAG